MRLILYIHLVILYSSSVFSQDTIPKGKTDLSDLSIEELMNLTIYSASKKLEKLNEAPAIASVLSRNDLLYFGGLTLIEVLKYVPDVEVSMGSEGFYRVSIRGTRKEGNILFLVDGKPMNDFYNGRALFDIPIAMIDRIEIVRGPGSSLFGSNAVAGVISVYTIKTTNITAIGSSEGAMGFTGNYFKEKNDFNFAFSASYLQNTTPRALIYQDREYSQTWSETYDSTAYVANRWNKDLILSTAINYKDFHLDLYSINRIQGAYVGPVYVAASDSRLISNQVGFSSLYNFPVSDNVIITPKIYLNWNSHDFTSQEAPDFYLSSQSGDLFTEGKLTRDQYDGLLYGAQLDVLVKVNKHFDLLTASIYEDMSLKNYSIERNYKIVSDEYIGSFGNYDDIESIQDGKRRYVSAYFVQGKFQYNKWNITGGLRYDDYSDFGFSFNPRLGITYKAGKNILFKGLAGKAFRAPTFLELYDNTTIGNENGVKGNDKLNPEIIKTVELGSELTLSRFILRYNVFFIQNENLIRVYDPHGTGSIGIYENIGDVQTYGHGAEGFFRLSQMFQLFVNYSHFISYYSWNENNVNLADVVFFSQQPNYNKELRNIPTMRLNAGLKFNYGKWRAFGGTNFGNPSQNNKRFYLEKDKYVEIPYYLQFNISGSYEVSPKLIVKIAATNLGKKYSDPEESTNIAAFGRNGLVQPGPMFSLQINYDF